MGLYINHGVSGLVLITAMLELYGIVLFLTWGKKTCDFRAFFGTRNSGDQEDCHPRMVEIAPRSARDHPAKLLHPWSMIIVVAMVTV